MGKILIGVVCLFFYSSMAQLDPEFSHFNQAAYYQNPAYLGEENKYDIRFIHRNQWTDFLSQPSQSLFTFYAPVSDNRIGLGIQAFNESYFEFKKKSLYGSCNYKIRVFRGELAMGLQWGGFHSEIDYESLGVRHLEDSEYQPTSSTYFKDVGVGFFYQNKQLQIGASIRHLIFEQKKLAALPDKHYYYYLKYAFNLDETWEIHTSANVKYSQRSSISGSGKVMLLYKSIGGIGVGCRTNTVLSGFLELHMGQVLKLDEELILGYSYDSKVEKIGTTNEVFLSFRIFKRESLKTLKYKKTVISPNAN